jgi:hypothetical protein
MRAHPDPLNEHNRRRLSEFFRQMIKSDFDPARITIPLLVAVALRDARYWEHGEEFGFATDPRTGAGEKFLWEPRGMTRDGRVTAQPVRWPSDVNLDRISWEGRFHQRTPGPVPKGLKPLGRCRHRPDPLNEHNRRRLGDFFRQVMALDPYVDRNTIPTLLATALQDARYWEHGPEFGFLTNPHRGGVSLAIKAKGPDGTVRTWLVQPPRDPAAINFDQPRWRINRPRPSGPEGLGSLGR